MNKSPMKASSELGQRGKDGNSVHDDPKNIVEAAGEKKAGPKKMLKVVGIYNQYPVEAQETKEIPAEELEKLVTERKDAIAKNPTYQALAAQGASQKSAIKYKVVWEDKKGGATLEHHFKNQLKLGGRGPSSDTDSEDDLPYKLTENLQFQTMQTRRNEDSVSDNTSQASGSRRRGMSVIPTHGPDGHKLSRKEREWLEKGNSLDPPVVVYGPNYFTKHDLYHPPGELYLLENGKIASGIKPTDQVEDSGVSDLVKAFIQERKLVLPEDDRFDHLC